MNCIFIDIQNEKSEIAIVENNTLVEYYIEEKTKRNILGNIYRGRVENVLKGMQAAFVNIGEGKNGYLYLTDALTREEQFSGKKHCIEDILKTGDEVIVQVIKEPLGDKGAKISTNFSFTGRYIVITPFQKGINVSRKIKDSEEIARLKQIGEEFKQDKIGMIFRTVSYGVEKGIILEEYKNLFKLYKKIEGKRNFLPTPKLLFEEKSLIYKIVIDNFNEKNYKIIVNNKDTYEKLLELEKDLDIYMEENLILDFDLDFKYNSIVQKGLKTALSKSVELKSGGSIIIETTEALTVIDVNTHKYVGTSSLESTIINTNIEAAEEIARQIRLRNIAGIIIVDFIGMKSVENTDKLIQVLEKCFSKDKNKPYVVSITKLGLVEITRKKERPTLETDFLIKCPNCAGRGLVLK